MTGRSEGGSYDAKFSSKICFSAKSKGSILHDVVDEKVDETWVQVKALREDISLLGFTPLVELHGRLDISWNKNIKYRKLLEVNLIYK